jgi:hypothetical protein
MEFGYNPVFREKKNYHPLKHSQNSTFVVCLAMGNIPKSDQSGNTSRNYKSEK